jgi:catechol 2,3-dioxygenase-like lactoylglutathione lyase family enzyme
MALDVRRLTPLLQVYDMPTSVRFYRDVLGFEVVSTSPRPKKAESDVWLPSAWLPCYGYQYQLP